MLEWMSTSSTVAAISPVILPWLRSWCFQTAPPLFPAQRSFFQQQFCNLRKPRCNPPLHFLLNFHREPSRVLPPRLLIIMNPIAQPCSHWLLIVLPCSVSSSTVPLMLIRCFDRNTTIKLTFIQLRLHPFLQLLSQLCGITPVTCCLIVLTLLCFRQQLPISSSRTCPILQSVHSALSCTHLCLISHFSRIAELLVWPSCL